MATVFNETSAATPQFKISRWQLHD